MNENYRILSVSWRAAHRVVKVVEPKLGDEDLAAVFHAVREIFAESFRLLNEQQERDRSRLQSTHLPEV